MKSSHYTPILFSYTNAEETKKSLGPTQPLESGEKGWFKVADWTTFKLVDVLFFNSGSC